MLNEIVKNMQKGMVFLYVSKSVGNEEGKCVSGKHKHCR